jgi:hypothetical protein
VQAEALLGQIARLVAHLLRPLDPIAEIDVGQAEAARFLDMVENDETPERPARDVGIVEGIDQRQAVGEAVGQADREQWPRAGLVARSAPRAIFVGEAKPSRWNYSIKPAGPAKRSRYFYGVLSVPAGNRGHSRKKFGALCAKSRVGHSVFNGDF